MSASRADSSSVRRRAVVVLWVVGFLVGIGSPELAGAMPADPNRRVELRQPAGESFEARPFGDEWYNGFETASGFTVLRSDSSHAWEYAEEGPDGELRSSGRRPGRDAPSGLKPHLRDERRAARRPQRGGSLRAAPSGPLAPSGLLNAPVPPNRGTHRSLVILVQFANRASLGTTAAQWSSRFFASSESVSDYYDEVSYGNLSLLPAAESHGTVNDGVVGWLTLPGNHPNTGQDTGPANQLVTRNAILAADPYVNFASYDANGDGKLSPDELHITVIPAGWEASVGCGTPSIWGHQWSTFNQTPTVDGVTAGWGYTQFGEEQCDADNSRPPRMATLGIMVHELGHDLDWPDLYDPDTTSYGGVGYWSIMGYGGYLALPNTDPGSSPAHPDAFSKSYQGWITPQRSIGTVTRSVARAATNPAAVQLLENLAGVDWNHDMENGTSEYFLLENRQRVGYDRALPGCGLLIWHVDETHPPFEANNNDARRLVDLEEADNSANFPFDALDAWTGNRTFDNTSSPNSRLYDATASGVTARNFSATCAPNMSADVSDGRTPVANDAFAAAAAVATLPFATTGLATADASTEPDEIPPTCRLAGKSVWYRFAPGTDAKIVVDTVGSTFNTVLAVYRGTALNALTPVVCNDDLDSATGNVRSRVQFDAGGGQTYYVQVAGFQAGVRVAAASGSLAVNVVALDTTAPETAIQDGPTGTTDDTTPTFAFSSSEPDSTLECQVDGAAFVACSSPFTTPVLGDGAHAFAARATDKAGNVDPTPAARAFTVIQARSVVAPPPPQPPPADRVAPRFSLVVRGKRIDGLVRRGLPVQVTRVTEAATVRATLEISRVLAKRLGIVAGATRGRPPVVIGRGSATLARPGAAKLTVSLTRSAKRRLRRAKGLSATLRARVTDAAGNTGTASRRLRFGG